MPETDPIVFELLELRAELKELILAERTRYTVGTWTPAWVGTSTAGVFTYTKQSGFYVQIGKLIFFWAQITISAIGTPPAGNMTISGLPIASDSPINSFGQVFWGLISHFNFTAAALALTGFIDQSVTTITLREAFDNSVAVNVPAANFTNVDCSVLLAGFYPVP
jgi:hypothetical protein